MISQFTNASYSLLWKYNHLPLFLLPGTAQRHRLGVAFSLRLSQKVPHISAFASAEIYDLGAGPRVLIFAQMKPTLRQCFPVVVLWFTSKKHPTMVAIGREKLTFTANRITLSSLRQPQCPRCQEQRSDTG